MAWMWAVSEGEGQRRCQGLWPERGWAVASFPALGEVLGDFARGLLQEGKGQWKVTQELLQVRQDGEVAMGLVGSFKRTRYGLSTIPYLTPTGDTVCMLKHHFNPASLLEGLRSLRASFLDMSQLSPLIRTSGPALPGLVQHPPSPPSGRRFGNKAHRTCFGPVKPNLLWEQKWGSDPKGAHLDLSERLAELNSEARLHPRSVRLLTEAKIFQTKVNDMPSK